MTSVSTAEIIIASYTDIPSVRQLCAEDGSFHCTETCFLEWQAGKNYPYILRLGNETVGFATVSLDAERREFVMQEFYISQRHRHNGYGRQLAIALFERFYGNWRVSFSSNDRQLYRFWRRIIQQFRASEYPEAPQLSLGDEEYFPSGEICTLHFSHQIPAFFQPFPVPLLIDGKMLLRLSEVHIASPQRQLLPSYDFNIEYLGKWVGNINFRVGNTLDILLYFGHIGYGVLAEYRGQHFAERACRMLIPLVQTHKISPLWITTTPDNYASRRTCERLGGRLIETIPLPVDYEINAGGKQSKCRYRIDL